MKTPVFYSLIDAPPGFAPCERFERRDFHVRPFALLVDSLEQAQAFLGERAPRLAGVVVTLRDEAGLDELHPLLYHLRAPHSWRTDLRERLAPLLNLLANQREAHGRAAVLELELKRATGARDQLSAEFDAIRRGLVREIEERRAAQQELQETEERFRNLFNLSPDGILLVDVESECFTSANQRICQMLGYREEELLGLGLADIHPERELALIRGQARNMTPGEIQLASDLPVRCKDGSVFFADVNAFSLMLGGRRQVMGTFRDVTGRKRAEEERRAHIHFLESLEAVDQAIKRERDSEKMLWEIERIMLSIFDCDRAWLVYPCDPEAECFRVPMEACKPEYPGAMAMNVDVPMFPDVRQNLVEALASDDPLVYIADSANPVNQVTTEQFRVQSQIFMAIYPRIGKPWVFGLHQCSHARQWTAMERELFKEIGHRVSDGLSGALFLRELKESEERFRAFYNLSPDGILLAEVESGRFVSANQRICQMLGYDEQELLGLGVDDIHPAQDLAMVKTQFQQQVAGEISLATDLPVLRKDGSVFYADVNSYPVTLGGKPHLMGSFRDATGRREAEQERRKLQEQLSQSQKMESVGRLAGGVAHDFNNMLGVILGYADMILQNAPPEATRAEVLEIRNAAQRSADLTRQLLAFARKQTVSPRVLDLNRTVEGMLKMLQRLIGEQIELSWTPCGDPWRVRIDPTQVDQLLANLCVNARDAIEGVGRIAISTERLSLDLDACRREPDLLPGDYLTLRVEDNGCGMKKEVLDHLFEPFFTTKSLGLGTGLGMATVYGIVRQNQGAVKVQSAPGQGTTVTVLLPRHNGDEPPLERPRAAGLPGGAAELLLLVEDEPMLLELCQRLLQGLGYRVLAAGLPGEAIRLAQEHAGEIKLLITDVIMPEMNGRQLASLLRSSYPDLRLLFMSGYTADLISLQGALEAHVHLLQKPFSLQDLAARVREALDAPPPALPA